MNYPREELTTAQHTEWEKCRAALTWYLPGFTHIFYTLLNNSGYGLMALFTAVIPIAATDAYNILLNPTRYFDPRYSIANRVFALAHEIMHCVLDHVRLNSIWAALGYVAYPDGTKLPYDSELMGWAEDYFINAVLKLSKAGEFHPDWLFREDLHAETKSVLEIYRILYDESASGYGRTPQGQPFDKLLPPGDTMQSNVPPRNQSQWNATIAVAANISRNQAKQLGHDTKAGKNALEMARLFEKFAEPVIDWSEKFVSSVMRKIGHDRYDWRKLDRRLITRGIVSPGKSGFAIKHIIPSCDASGSMTDDDVTKCWTEVAGMLDQIVPEKITVLWHDTHVHRVDVIEDTSDLIAAKMAEPPHIGGGTDFCPVFKWIEENCDDPPDALIMLTDGEGDFPAKAPEYPVWWVCISKEGTIDFPFGEVIWMPHKNR